MTNKKAMQDSAIPPIETKKSVEKPYTAKATPDTYWLLEGVSLLVLTFLGGLFVRGEANVPPSGTVLMVSNHVSYLDPVAIGDAAPRRVVFMAKAELFKSRVLGFLLRGVDSFPVKRGESDRSAFKTTLEMLNEGRVVCIFPEGTRSPDGTIGDAEPGAAVFAQKTGCAVVPVYVDGSRAVLGMDNKIRRGRITVTFGTAFTVPKDLARDAAGTLLMDAVRRTKAEADSQTSRRIWPHWIKKRREGSRSKK